MKYTIILCVISGLVGLLAWTTYVHIDERFSNPWPVRKLHATSVLGHTIGEFMEYFGIMKIEDVYREMVKLTLRSLQTKSVQDMDIFDKEIDGIPVRIRTPKGKSRQLLPGVIYIHGGAFIVGDRYQHDKILIDMAEDLGAVVISLTYRLSFEALWPGPLEDCLKVSRHFLTHAAEYGIEPNKIAIGGDSAGGHMTASLMQVLRDEQFLLKPKSQFLIYMTGQIIDGSFPSRIQNAQGPIVTRTLYNYALSNLLVGNISLIPTVATNAHVTPKVRRLVLNKLASHDLVPEIFCYPPYDGPITGNDVDTWNRIKHLMLKPYLNPLLTEDLSNLPPAFVFTTQYDITRDDGILYAKALERAGVPVEHFHHQIAPHSVFGLMYTTKEGRELYDALVGYLHKQLN